MEVTEYRAHPALSYSKLKAYLKSALHGLNQEPPSESAAMRFGSAVDLGMKNQIDQVIINPFEDGRTRGAKEFKLEHAGKLVLTQSEMEKALACVVALKNHPAVRELGLDKLEPDLPLFGSIDGIPLKGLPDWALGRTLIDLKTTSAPLEDFARTVDNFHYDLQAELYSELAKQAGHENPLFYWIVVESDRPFDIVVHKAPEQVFRVGRAKLLRALHNVKLAQSGGFLGTSDAILELTMPPWYGRRFEEPYCI